jgi:hypothetical protein
MAIDRANLGRGPAHVDIGGVRLYTRDDLVPRHAPVWNPVAASMYGEVDKFKQDLVIKFGLTLFGTWENLAVLFPTAVLAPNIGAALFGATDSAVSITAKNGDKVTYHNAAITKLADLYLGVDSELFAAAVEITALIKNNVNPEDAAAYYTLATAQAYTENVFAKTNFKKGRWTGAWGAKTGFTTITAKEGWNVGWDLSLEPITVDGLGTVDYTIAGMVGRARCIPMGPTLAQIETLNQVHGIAHGTLLSAGGADLTLASATAPAGTVVLKNAGAVESGHAYGIRPLRVGEMAWATTRGFTAGAPNAVSTVAAS